MENTKNIKIDDEAIKLKKEKISNILFRDDFYKAAQRIDKKKFCSSIEAALLCETIEKGFSFPVIVKERIAEISEGLGIKEGRESNVLTNIFTGYLTSSYCRAKIDGIKNNEKNLKIKVSPNFRQNFEDFHLEMLKTYTDYINLDILANKENRNIKSIEDLIHFSESYFASILDAALNEKEKILNSENFDEIYGLPIEFDNLVLGNFNYEWKKEEKNIEKVLFQEIGGLGEAKREFIYLSKGLKNPQIYEEEGTRPPQGIILIGPPGVGKTLLVKALAYETNIPFTIVPIKDIVTKWYGESSRNIAKYLEKEGIVFLDEIDTLARSRDNVSCEATDMIVNTINQAIGGNRKTLFIAATNKIEDVDEAVKRAGRFDKIICCKKPDYDEINEIFEIHKKKAERTAKKELFSNLDYKKFTTFMYDKGMVGADICEITRRCLEKRVYARLDGGIPEPISTNAITEQINKYERNENNNQR